MLLVTPVTVNIFKYRVKELGHNNSVCASCREFTSILWQQRGWCIDVSRLDENNVFRQVPSRSFNEINAYAATFSEICQYSICSDQSLYTHNS